MNYLMIKVMHLLQANDTPGGGAEAYLFPILGFPGYRDGPYPGNPFITGESQNM